MNQKALFQITNYNVQITNLEFQIFLHLNFKINKAAKLFMRRLKSQSRRGLKKSEEQRLKLKIFFNHKIEVQTDNSRIFGEGRVFIYTTETKIRA